jgi:hypothetical protein
VNAKVQRQLASGKRKIAKRLARRAKAGRAEGPQFSASNMPPQQNLWVLSGSGSLPSV